MGGKKIAGKNINSVFLFNVLALNILARKSGAFGEH